MKEILICGSGKFAREVYWWVKQSENQLSIKFKGFLDFSDENLKKHNLQEFYLGDDDNYNFSSNEYVIIPISEVHIRNKVFNSLKQRNVNFYNFIHPSVIMGGDISFGRANIICPNCILTTNINMGDCNIFNLVTTIGHDVTIGSFNTFSSHCDITGNVVIGDFNYSGSRVSFLPYCKIGNNNQISAGSVVYKGVKNNSLLLGNPAKKIGDNI